MSGKMDFQILFSLCRGNPVGQGQMKKKSIFCLFRLLTPNQNILFWKQRSFNCQQLNMLIFNFTTPNIRKDKWNLTLFLCLLNDTDY